MPSPHSATNRPPPRFPDAVLRWRNSESENMSSEPDAVRQAPDGVKSFDFSDEVCAAIARLFFSYSGIRLPPQKYPLIRSRFSKTVARLRLRQPDQFFQFLQEQRNAGNLDDLLECLTTNHTFFLREKVHFEIMVDHLTRLPTNALSEPIRVWSAGCATGEEPYSIACFLADHFGVNNAGWQVIGSDISRKAIGLATAGIYPDGKLLAVPAEWRAKYFLQGGDEHTGEFKVKPCLARHVLFRQENLLKAVPATGAFQVIFCRNLFIYLDRDIQQALLDRFHEALSEGGLLFTGHSESLAGMNSPFSNFKPSVYQKGAAPCRKSEH